MLQKLKKLDSTKAPGVDGISSRVLVELADKIAEPLADIFQNSLELPQYPMGESANGQGGSKVPRTD